MLAVEIARHLTRDLWYTLTSFQKHNVVSNPRSFELCPSVCSCRLKLYLNSHRIWRMFLFSLAFLSNSISGILHQLSHVSALWLDPLHSVSTLKIFSIRTYVSCLELWEKPHTPTYKVARLLDVGRYPLYLGEVLESRFWILFWNTIRTEIRCQGSVFWETPKSTFYIKCSKRKRVSICSELPFSSYFSSDTNSASVKQICNLTWPPENR